MSICAVIVSYFPGNNFFDNIDALFAQVDHVLVVDNNSGSSGRMIFERLSNHINFSVIYFEDNLGIASALNAGVRYAIEHQYEWVLTLDQDSRVAPAMISMMLEAYEARDDKPFVAILSPRYRDVSTGLIRSGDVGSFDQDNAVCSQVLSCITSGSLIKTSIFMKAGFFNDSYFIDYVDIEYCLRCSKLGFKVLQVNDAILLHSLGNFKINKFLWMHPISTNHSPLRRYYYFRNAIFTYRKYFFSHTRWVFANLFVLMKTILVVVFFEDRIIEKSKAILYGVFDGFFNNSGRCARNIK